MARQTTPLTVKEINAAKPKDKEYKLFDGGGLYLSITPKGQKWWRMKYRFDGKEKRISLGVYPDVPLADKFLTDENGKDIKVFGARSKRELIKAKIAEGIDPGLERKEQKEEVKAEEVKASNTFEVVARAYLNKRNELNEDYMIRLERAFKNDVFKFIGKKPITEIMPKDIIEIVKRVQDRGAVESAHRLFTQISKVFKYAVSNQMVDRNPCSEMEKKEILKSHTRRHYPTITNATEIKNLLLSIDEYTGDYAVKMALRLAPYIFVRPSNLRFAQWQEIDFEKKIWVIPADKMKTKKEHIIPLTDTTLAIFQEMYKYSADAKYIFHSLRSTSSPMSDATLNNALRRMGYSKEEIVVHGFRAMFSTITHEKSDFDHQVIETQLAHSVGSKVSQAYNRAMYLDERKELMQWWSYYLDGIKNN